MMVEQSFTLVLVLVALFVRMLAQSETEQLRRERLEERQAEAARGAVSARAAPPSPRAPRRPGPRGPSSRTAPFTATSRPKVTSPSTSSRRHSRSEGGPPGSALEVPISL